MPQFLCRGLLLLALLVSGLGAAEPALSEAPLIVWNRPLAVFRAPVGFASVTERAERAAERIAKLPAEALELTVVAQPAKVGELSGVMLYAGPHFLFAIADQDLDAANGETMPVVSQQAVDRVRELFSARREATHDEVIVTGLALALASTLGLLVSLVILIRIHRTCAHRLHPSLFQRLPLVLGLDLRDFAYGVSHGILRLPFFASGATALYFWLVLVFSGFPYTRPWAHTLGTWLWNVAATLTQGMVNALPGLFIVLVIILLTRFAARSLTAFFTGVEEGRLHVGWMQPETARATRRIAVVLLWLFALTVSYPYMPGSSSEAFKGVSVFAGLVLTLGSSGMVNQVMSGLMVVYARSMRPGDIVQIGDTVGTVVDLGLLSTRVRTARLEEVAIPNAVLVGSTVTNFSRHDGEGMVLCANVTIGYDTPWRQVHALLTLAASRTPGVRTTPEPFVVQKALDDWYVAYELRARLERAEDRFPVQSELHARIQDVFNEHGVQIMSPHFIAQPTQAVVVPKTGWAPPPAVPI
jgi:small-conductance mechanosensitive channel